MASSTRKLFSKFGSLYNLEMALQQFFHFEHGYIGQKDICPSTFMVFACERRSFRKASRKVTKPRIICLLKLQSIFCRCRVFLCRTLQHACKNAFPCLNFRNLVPNNIRPFRIVLRTGGSLGESQNSNERFMWFNKSILQLFIQSEMHK